MAAPASDTPQHDPSVARPASGSRGSSSGDEPTRVSEADSAPAGQAHVIPLGPSIEGYVLKEEIHRGGQGIVYRALQLGTKRQVALKVLLEGPYAGETARRRFEREIELAASLHHPNIVTILDSGLSSGRYYFAMEYVHGVRLDRYVAQQRPSLADTLLLFERVCLAVNFAHQRGVIHRDLKPPNILVDNEGEPHILDFGLAKPVHQLAASESTVQVLSTSGQLLGTVAYMSPEQAAGSQDLDVRSDVYSLGVIFYEALVGQPPYSVDGPLGEVLTRIASDEPVNPRSLTGRTRSGLRVGDELATILLKALEKEPQRRYQTAGDLARDLRHLLQGEPIEAKRASGLYMLKKALRRYRLHAAAAGLILLMLFGFLITLAVLWTGERDARRRADAKTEEARLAVFNRETALREARERTAEAVFAQQSLRRALGRQHIQRGDLALERHDLMEARESYWKALEAAPGPAAVWALRRYYLQTADNGAALVTFESHGPRKLSPNGRLAAVCAGRESLGIRPLGPRSEASWLRAPGPITHVDVADDGSLAAVGPGWARAWPPGALRPSVSVQLPAPERVHTVYVLAGGEGLLLVSEPGVQRGPVLVSERRVRLFRGPGGEVTQTTLLQGSPTGRADYAPSSRQLAIPTSAGVELVSILDDGALRSEVVWTGNSAARAVNFDGEELLAVLADAVYVTTVADLGQGQWTRFIDAAPDWDLFDLKHGVGLIVFATRDGRLAVYRSGDLVGTWRYAVNRLDQLRLSAEDRSTVTLDDSGTVAHWVPPERVEQRRLIHVSQPTTWATAGDGSTILMAVGRGEVVAYSPGLGSEPRTVLRPRLLGFGDDGMALAISADGRRAVIRDRSALRLVTLADLSAHLLPWSYSARSVPDKVGLSGDGELVALLVRSQTGDQQQIAFSRWRPLGADAAEEDRPAPQPLDFVGALVRDMAFVPRSRQLLVLRSNGQLLLLDPERRVTVSRAASGETPADESPVSANALETWMQLDSAATAVAFNRTGEYLAVACEDDVVRLISVARQEVRYRIPVGRSVSALAFNPRDDVLLVRTSDGTVRLFDPATGEELASWQAPAKADHPLATWLGDNADAMLLGQTGGVYEYRFAEADAVIERNRAYAGEQRVVRLLADAEFAAAWAAAEEVRQLDHERGLWAQLTVLEAALRRPSAQVRPEWVDNVLAQSPAANRSAALARLGHAAYEGERFDLARGWLRRARELAAGALDAFTLWRIAECDYLAEDYEQAAAQLAGVIAQPDSDPARAPIAALQRVAALVLAGRLSDARQAAMKVGDPDPQGRYGDIVASTYAWVNAAALSRIEREDARAAAVDSLLAKYGERRLLFEDDEHFFGGELARLRGDRALAAVKYQRCIDLARDEWPANWARYRLAQLSPPAGNEAGG